MKEVKEDLISGIEFAERLCWNTKISPPISSPELLLSYQN
jgi:hypothetical protein